MENKINILNELREAGSTVLINADRNNYFSIPSDYFNDLSENILSRIFVESLPTANPYAVPAGYFENFPEVLLQKIAITGGVETREEMPYSVPDGYFDNLANNILQKIKQQQAGSVMHELEELSPFLSRIDRINVYTVPEDYFEQLAPITEIARPAAKVISISRPRKWMAYAAAACIAAILFGGGFLYIFNGVTNPGASVHRQVAGIDVQKGITELTDAEIASYLNQDNSTAVYSNQNQVDDNDLDLNTLLENTSDEEIEQYLKNNSEPGDVVKGI